MNENNPEEIESNNPVVPKMIDDQGNLGEIQIALPVVENMVRMIALDVEGVVDVIGVGSGSISGIFGNKSDSKSGVKVAEDEAGGYAIEIRVSLEFGVELATVAYNIQQLVIDKITKMTSKSVTKVDVFIDRVEKPGVKKVEVAEKAPEQKTQVEDEEKPETEAE